MNQSVRIFLDRTARGGALCIAAIGAAACIGWIFHIDALTRVLPGLVTMKFNTALAFLAIGVALSLARDQKPPPWAKRLALLLGAAVAAIGLLTLVEYAARVNLKIDEFIIAEGENAVQTPNPGRMAPATAVAFLLTGIGILLLFAKSEWLEMIAQAASLAVLVIALITLVGYAYAIESFFQIGPTSSMALHTGFAFMLCSIVLLAMRPDRGFMSILASDTVTGDLARRLTFLLPAAIFIVGGLRINGSTHQVTQLDLALVVVLSMTVSALLVAWQTGVLYSVEMAGIALQQTANTDPLTGLHNRRSLTRHLEREWARAQRYRGALSIVMVDVDHFKSYNDAYGHQAGDELLKQFAGILAASARGIDFTARYGGEEFMVILPGTDEKGAAIFAERLRGAIEAAEFPHRAVTASFGVASCTGHPGDGAEGSQLIGEADRALYLSKQAGRNRVTVVRFNPDGLAE